MQLGLAKVPVHVAKDLSPERIKAYRIADNKTAELAEWDFDLLPIELGGLPFLFPQISSRDVPETLRPTLFDF